MTLLRRFLLVAFLCLGPSAAHAAGEICDNEIDDDGDGFVDCIDWDCDDDPACAAFQEVCTGGSDEDGDSFVDCDDFDCENDPA
ncbi:MAG: hypothetical protein FJ098_15120, partial [Deltaproteobacteria bacterium]|nr:hypothetical protein [Deltaproteobacteria bacterium]